MSYDAAGRPTPEVAQSIETTDNVNYRIVLKPGWKFTDGSPVTAHSFVDAWNYGALSTNAQLQQNFFSPIEGFDDVAGAAASGQAEHHVRAAGGQRPRVHRPAQGADHRLHAEPGAQRVLSVAVLRHFGTWRRSAATRSATAPTGSPTAPTGRRGNTTSRSTWCANPDYHGNRKPRNKGLRFEFYANLDTAYADLLSGNLDVLDTIPSSALTIYKQRPGRQRDQRTRRRQPVARHSVAAAAFRRRGGPAAPAGDIGGDQPPADLSADLQRNPQPRTRFHRQFVAGIRPEHPGQRRVGLQSRTGPATLGAGQRDLAVERAIRHRLQRRQRSSGMGGRGGQQHQERAGHRRGRRTAAHLRRVPHPDHQPHHRHRVPRRLDRRLSVDDRVPRPAVRHRSRDPTMSDTPARSSTPRWRPPRRRPICTKPMCWSTSHSESCCTTCPPCRCGTTSV